MSSFIVEVQDKEVRAALEALQAKVGNAGPLLRTLGEDMYARIKGRFETSTGPDGQRWAANSQVTLERYIGKRGGIGKKGINKKGQGLAMAKKPLIGESRDLSRENHWNVTGNVLTVGNTMKYAAMQQFGGTRAQFPNLWGDIPARPFFPITLSGDLYPAEQSAIIQAINDYLAEH